MSPCENCGDRINRAAVDSVVAGLRDLTADNFNICDACIHVKADACARCSGDVYIPRDADTPPTLCPACRVEVIRTTGSDPGWKTPPADV